MLVVNYKQRLILNMKSLQGLKCLASLLPFKTQVKSQSFLGVRHNKVEETWALERDRLDSLSKLACYESLYKLLELQP